MDLNTFAWVSQKTIFGGAKLSLTATLLINNNSLTSDVVGPISGGGGFGDSYYQPFILGWQKDRTAIRVVYGFLAPTGKFQAGTNDNVGSGYWVSTFSSGQTFYLTKTKATSLSAFQMYEIHGTQKDTNIHPGQTLSLDYSLMQNIPLRNDNMRETSACASSIFGSSQTDRRSKGTPFKFQARSLSKLRRLHPLAGSFTIRYRDTEWRIRRPAGWDSTGCVRCGTSWAHGPNAV